MARIWMCGFEQDSLDAFTSYSGGPSISSASPRTDTYHFRTTTTVGDVGLVVPETCTTELFFRVYARIVSGAPVASAVWFSIRDDDAAVLLEITETGQVWLGQQGVGVDKGNAGPLTASYARWEVQFLVDNAAGLLDVLLNGVSVISDSGIDTQPGASDCVDSMRIGNVRGATQRSKDFDDVAINDTSGSYNNSWCGPGAILGCVSIDDGTTNEFSRFPDTGEANWEDVDERPPNDDTDYVFATAVEQDELYDVTSMETTHGVPRATQVRAVAWWMYHKLVYNGDGEIAPLHVQLGSLQQMPAIACTEIAYAYAFGIREENSITSAEFNAGDIDDSEFGFRSKAP